MAEPLDTASVDPNRVGAFILKPLTTSDDVLKHEPHLSTLLRDCVDEGSSIGFLAPLSANDAKIYWSQVASQIAPERLHLFILTSPAFDSNKTDPILGTVQLSLIPKATHLHRGEVIKLMVSPSARRRGIAQILMAHIEVYAKDIGRTVLTLDTATETPAREMYLRLGWEEWGTCKGYASWSDGTIHDATFFRKTI